MTRTRFFPTWLLFILLLAALFNLACFRSPRSEAAPVPEASLAELAPPPSASALEATEELPLPAAEAPLAAPETTAREDAVAAREARLADRQAELERREQVVAAREESLRQRESNPPSVPAAPVVEVEEAVVPAAEPEPRPVVVPVTLEAGTPLRVELLEPLSSRESVAGDRFEVRVTEDVWVRSELALPAGTRGWGAVAEAVPQKGIGGRSRLALDLNELLLPSGERVSIDAGFALRGRSETKKDGATIGGATAGGAILGRVLSDNHKSRGTVLGAIVGAAVGSAVASRTRGEEVELEAGTVLEFQLRQWARVQVRR